MQTDTKSILNAQIDDTPSPPTIPQGRWLFEIADCGYSTKADNHKAWFNLAALGAVDTGNGSTTPDPDEAEEYLETTARDRPVFHSYSDGRLHQCRMFLTAIGAKTSGLTWKNLGDLAGLRFYATVTHAGSRDPERPWVRFNDFAADDGTAEA